MPQACAYTAQGDYQCKGQFIPEADTTKPVLEGFNAMGRPAGVSCTKNSQCRSGMCNGPRFRQVCK